MASLQDDIINVACTMRPSLYVEASFYFALVLIENLSLSDRDGDYLI